jgi:hypothetical protein
LRSRPTNGSQLAKRATECGFQKLVGEGGVIWYGAREHEGSDHARNKIDGALARRNPICWEALLDRSDHALEPIGEDGLHRVPLTANVTGERGGWTGFARGLTRRPR